MDANGVDLVVIGLEEFGAEEFVELNFFEGGMFCCGFTLCYGFSNNLTVACFDNCEVLLSIGASFHIN